MHKTKTMFKLAINGRLNWIHTEVIQVTFLNKLKKNLKLSHSFREGNIEMIKVRRSCMEYTPQQEG